MSYQQQILFLNICACSTGIPLVISIVKKSYKGHSLFVVYMAYVLLAYFVQVKSVGNGTNLYLSYIFPSVNTALLVGYFSPKNRKYTLLAVLMVIASSLGEAIGGVHVFSSVASTLSNILIASAAILKAIHISGNDSRQASKVPIFWISAGAAIYFVFSLTVDLARQSMLEISNETLAYILLIRSGVFMLVFMLCSSIGFLKS